jgi:hypothetical protein
MNAKRLLKFQSGNAASVYCGYGAFTTTGTTVDVASPFGTIVGAIITPVGAAAAAVANGALTLVGTIDTSTDAAGNTQGTVARDASGNVTIGRAAGTDSGLAFYYVLFGY